jgi:OOP family OmpA-OmpF porin
MMGQRTTATAIAAALAIALSGCATLRDNPTACRAATALAGGALGATGGGVGVDQIGKNPDNGEIAAGAAAGLVAGSLVGLGVGYLICPEEQPPPAPRVAQAPPPPPPPPPAPGKHLAELRAPHFDFDKAKLKPEGEHKVDEAIQVMQQNPNLRVVCEGYTDSIGSAAYNLKLGQRRATAVKDYMVRHGVAADRIDVKSYGEANPIASNKTAEGRAQNRRVDITVE